MKCIVCENEVSLNDIRDGVCWNCAQAESIIAEGVDMFDKGLGGKSAVSAMDKVRLLMVHGWHHGGLTQRAADVCTCGHPKSIHMFFEDHDECNVCTDCESYTRR